MITLVGSIGLVVYAVRAISRGELDSGMIALLGAAGYGMYYTLGSWSGRPEISLLLKLLDAQIEDTEQAAPSDARNART
jgi:hypothetical protein